MERIDRSREPMARSPANLRGRLGQGASMCHEQLGSRNHSIQRGQQAASTDVAPLPHSSERGLTLHRSTHSLLCIDIEHEDAGWWKDAAWARSDRHGAARGRRSTSARGPRPGLECGCSRRPASPAARTTRWLRRHPSRRVFGNAFWPLTVMFDMVILPPLSTVRSALPSPT